MGGAMFEWDESKRLKCLDSRELDFINAVALFDGRPVVTILAKTETEVRWVTWGRLADEKLYTVVWTQRGDARRIISFRRARIDEERAYHTRYGRTGR